MNNYLTIFSKEDGELYEQSLAGRFNRVKYKENLRKFSLENWQDLIKLLHIWDLPFKEEDNEEDNDTSEEEDEVDNDLPEKLE